MTGNGEDEEGSVSPVSTTTGSEYNGNEEDQASSISGSDNESAEREVPEITLEPETDGFKASKSIKSNPSPDPRINKVFMTVIHIHFEIS